MDDLDIVYERLKNRYAIKLASTVLTFGEDTVITKAICGASGNGEFILYKDTDDAKEFVFSTEHEKHTLFRRRPKKCGTHRHPQSVEDAVADVIVFMECGMHGKSCVY